MQFFMLYPCGSTRQSRRHWALQVSLILVFAGLAAQLGLLLHLNIETKNTNGGTLPSLPLTHSFTLSLSLSLSPSLSLSLSLVF